MERNFPQPLLLEKPKTHLHMAVLVRPVQNFAMAALGQALGQVLYHVGIHDLQKDEVYHVNDPVGSQKDAADQIQQISFIPASLQEFQGAGGGALYFYDHGLSEAEQLEALARARRLLGSPVTYDGVSTNCQTVVLDILFPLPQPQQVELAQKIIHTAFDFWIANLPVYDDDETPPNEEKVDEIILSLKRTFFESVRGGAKVGAAALVGGAFLGPPGFAVGGVVGGLWAWATSNDFDAICNKAAEIAQNLTTSEKRLLLRRLQATSVMIGCSSLHALIIVNRTAFTEQLRINQ